MRGFGGVVSFVVKGGLEGASRVIDATKLARIGPSFGGVESLIEQPAVMSYYEMTTEQRARHRHRRRPRAHVASASRTPRTSWPTSSGR